MTTAAQLTQTQVRGLLKVGDILIPGDQECPSFSRSGCAAQVDRMLEYMYESDRSGISALLGVFAYLPRAVIHAALQLTEHHAVFPGPIGATLRMINVGVKGVVMTLYYSDVGQGPSVYQLIGYDAKVVERPAQTVGG